MYTFSNHVNGPWEKILQETLEDSRSQADPLPAQEFLLESSKAGRYVKFKMLSWHGSGGGLQYFEMIEGNNISTLSTAQFDKCCDQLFYILEIVFDKPNNKPPPPPRN